MSGGRPRFRCPFFSNYCCRPFLDNFRDREDMLFTDDKHLQTIYVGLDVWISGAFGPFLRRRLERAPAEWETDRPAKNLNCWCDRLFFCCSWSGVGGSSADRPFPVGAILWPLFFSRRRLSCGVSIGRSHEITERRKIPWPPFRRALRAATTGKQSRPRHRRNCRVHAVVMCRSFFFGLRRDGPQKDKGKEDHHRRHSIARETD